MSKGYIKIAAPVVPQTPRPRELKHIEVPDSKHSEATTALRKPYDSPDVLDAGGRELKVLSGVLSGHRRSKRGNTRHKARKGRRGAPALPPSLDAVITCSHTFRFQCVTGFSALQNITGGNLAGAIGGICTTANTTVKTIASSIRVHKVTVWPSVQATPQNPPEIVWFSPITVMEKDASRERVLPAGITMPAAVASTPPRNTLCSDWFAVSSGASQPMFGFVNIAGGDIIDVSLSWTVTNNLLSSTPAIATGVLGTYYYLYLDGSTAHQLQPVGKPTTF